MLIKGMMFFLSEINCTSANEHAASMRGLSVRKVVEANKMETKSKDKIC
jgi:hypothetical protein